MSLFSIFELFFDLRQDLCARTHSIMLKNPTHQYDSWDSLSFNDANISKIIDNGKLKRHYCLKQRLFLTYIKSHHLVVLFLLYNTSQCLPLQLSNLVDSIYNFALHAFHLGRKHTVPRLNTTLSFYLSPPLEDT